MKYKISDLIKRLRDIKDKEGDLDVLYDIGFGVQKHIKKETISVETIFENHKIVLIGD